MATTTTTAGAADHLDPWGFGRCDEARGAVVEHSHDAAAPATLAALEAHEAQDAFPPFAERHAAARRAAEVRAGTREWLAVLAVFAVAVLGQAFYIGYRLSGDAPAAASAELLVSSHPAGLDVSVDGRPVGVTPILVSTRPGAHRVEVGTPDRPVQSFEADVKAGGRWTRHVSAADTAAAVLGVDTGTAAAEVAVDGESLGAAPLVRHELPAGEHVVRVTFASGAALERRVTLAAAERLSLVADAPAGRSAPSARVAAITAGAASAPSSPARQAAPAAAVGWVRIESPFEVEIYEQGRALGTSGVDRVALPPGGHALELVNEALGYRVMTKVVVLSGRTSAVPVETPRAVVHVNAQPWAEVLVDGRLLGETPLANVMLPIGHHQVVLRHPELGERSQAFTVRAGGPNRISADLRR